jgi:MFS family permease
VLSRGAPAVREALKNRNLLRLVLAFAVSAIAEWAVWLGVLVYAFERGGPRAAGFASLGLLVPALFAAPIAGRAADGARPNRVLAMAYTVQALTVAAAAVAASLDAHAAVVIAIAAVSIGTVSFIRPCCSVVIPGLVYTAGDLTAANVIIGYCESASMLFGPLLAGVLLEVHGAWLVFAAAAGLLLLAASVTAPLSRFDVHLDMAAAAPSGASHVQMPSPSLHASLRSLTRRRGAASLLWVLASQSMLIGALDLLYVVLALDVLDLGASGSGYLSASFGVGAVLGGFVTTALIGRRQLATLIVLAVAVTSASLLVLGITITVIGTLLVLPVIGLSRSVVDVSGRMLLQRAAPQDSLASVFAVVEMIAGIGIAAGSLFVQLLIGVSGATAALYGLGLLFAVVLVGTARGLRLIDASADAPVVTIRLLRMISIFAPLSGPELEGTARAAVEVEVPAGTTIIETGEIGDRYYAIASGDVEVLVDGASVRTMSRGEGFGEIALLAEVPRTATVRSITDVRLVAIPRVPFLMAVTGHDASVRSAWAVARRLHPSIDQ